MHTAAAAQARWYLVQVQADALPGRCRSEHANDRHEVHCGSFKAGERYIKPLDWRGQVVIKRHDPQIEYRIIRKSFRVLHHCSKEHLLAVQWSGKQYMSRHGALLQSHPIKPVL